MLLTAFNLGITHFDATNNYGPPPGSVTTALIGASKPEQIIENVKILDKRDFSIDELEQINKILDIASTK